MESNASYLPFSFNTHVKHLTLITFGLPYPVFCFAPYHPSFTLSSLWSQVIHESIIKTTSQAVFPIIAYQDISQTQHKLAPLKLNTIPQTNRLLTIHNNHTAGPPYLAAAYLSDFTCKIEFIP